MSADFSKLAVYFDTPNKEKYSYCGLCQYGCPDDLIYSSRHTLQELLKNPNFSYIPDIIVEKFQENSSSVTIYAHSRKTKKLSSYIFLIK